MGSVSLKWKANDRLYFLKKGGVKRDERQAVD